MRKLAVAFALVAACGQPAPAAREPSPAATTIAAPAAPVTEVLAPTEPAPIVATPPKPPPPPRKPGAWANLDPDDDFVVGPPDLIPECDAELAKAGVVFERATLRVHTEPKSKITCGAPQVLVYKGSPAKIAYPSPPLLTCGMALALASFEKILQEESNRIFRTQVARIDHIGTYSCREVAAYKGTVSEHSYANAIDLVRFVLKNGKSIEVLRDFDATKTDDPPKRPEGQFLRVVSRRANDEDVFSHVLTPFFDAGHQNHFHLDLARFRADGTRP
jgi:hypothetical protein